MLANCYLVILIVPIKFEVYEDKIIYARKHKYLLLNTLVERAKFMSLYLINGDDLRIEPLNCIKVNQNGTTFYLTSMTTKQLDTLEEAGKLKVERYQYQEEEDSYQRLEDRPRTKDLAEFLTEDKEDQVVARILPGSVILNFPDNRDLTFDDKTKTLMIRDDAKINIVDGQHRIIGLLNAYRSSNKKFDFELPITILCGFDKFREAAQFLIINLKQKGVPTDLTLTVLYQVQQLKTKDFIRQLKNILKVDAWKLDGTAIAMDLNDSSDTYWHNHILRPNEERKNLKRIGRKWVPIRQAGFVDTLRYFCNATKTDEESRIDFLKRFWNGLRTAFPNAFDDDIGKNYILMYGNGVGVLHVLAAAFYNIDSAGLYKLEDSIDRLKNKYPLPNWENDSEMARSWGTSQKEFKVNAERLLSEIFPELDIMDRDKLKEYVDKNLLDENIEEEMRNLFDIFELKSKELIAKDLDDNKGIYLLVNKKASRVTAYIGQSKVIKSRLSNHPRDFKAFSKINIEKEQLNKIEALVYHLTKAEYRTNNIHPPYTPCEFCKK